MIDRSKICVVQFYTDNVPYGSLSEEINKAYCQTHGYSYYVQKDTQIITSALSGRSPTWYKPKLILEVFEKLNPEYVLFLDIDAAVVDFEQTIEQFIDPQYDVIFCEDYSSHSVMNAGVFLIKNTNFTKELMHTWWYSGEIFKREDSAEMNSDGMIYEDAGYFKTAIWHDQTCMTLLYRRNMSIREKMKIIANTSLNWKEPFEGNFIFHAFGYGQTPLRRLDYVYHRLIDNKINALNLNDLASIYPTDKQYLHNYFEKVYQTLLSPLQNTTKKFVELGIADGNCLRIWKEFFPNTQILGLDLYPENARAAAGVERITLQQIDQSNKEQLEQFAIQHPDIDIFLDDGSHKMFDQQITFATIFKALPAGSLYILEDLHTSLECRMPEKAIFGWGDPTRTTTLEMLEEFNRTGTIRSDYLTPEECEYLANHIQSCTIHRVTDHSITSAIIKK